VLGFDKQRLIGSGFAKLRAECFGVAISSSNGLQF
jgi:hypothetical protein